MHSKEEGRDELLLEVEERRLNDKVMEGSRKTEEEENSRGRHREGERGDSWGLGGNGGVGPLDGSEPRSLGRRSRKALVEWRSGFEEVGECRARRKRGIG